MKKRLVFALLLFLSVSLSSFGVHKFYMGIYQINYSPEKKMLQVTSRIFVDDLNKALEKKYNKKFFIGSDKETLGSVELLKKYLVENFSIKVNGQSKTMNFLSKEMDADVLICYSNVKDISKINSLEISNSVLIDCFSEQQNIVHVTVFGTKKSLLFTETSMREVLKY
ncbi:DUF6702 family protein [Flavobacterium gilvum]|uniref:Uncharacterized protein n=1 Tax=Flavobacterium gilvum TaxID=1492737 RepID=A0AAC9N6R4_9FLAO|nr:DUF6702 family protein [Flavobacterium gilvum]AOW09253.1 hypothetical protein EM308_06890 [Flavobacterium gilvum]KFC60127.1 hypothetical protein FEM08_11280 [Flavobacterium gilvum]